MRTRSTTLGRKRSISDAELTTAKEMLATILGIRNTGLHNRDVVTKDLEDCNEECPSLAKT